MCELDQESIRGENGVPQIDDERLFHCSNTWPSMFWRTSWRSLNREFLDETFESVILTRTQGSSEDSSTTSSDVLRLGKEANTIEIDCHDFIHSVASLADGRHIVSGGNGGQIQCWRVEDGHEVGPPMNAASVVFSVGMSRDGKWVVSGSNNGLVAVWNAKSRERVSEFKGHGSKSVRAVDVSPDATKFASGADDKIVSVWSLAGKRLLGPLRHDYELAAVKFSPNGRLLATATWDRNSVRIYDTQNSDLLVDFPVRVSSSLNQSLAWANDSKQLFALSRDGNIHCLDASSNTATPSRWLIERSNNNPKCITLASNGRFIVASSDSSVSFWDTMTHEQIGSVIGHTHAIWSMAVLANYDLVIAGDKKITLIELYGIIPSSYFDVVSTSASETRCTKWLPNHKPLR